MQVTSAVELFDLTEWAHEPDDADESVLARCQRATLDIGCGPGRMVLELTRRGIPSLGIDILPEAVRQVRRRGGLALQRSVFGPLPGEGRWSNALLLDGCVGIGGTPGRLLSRIRELIGPDGLIYVEHEPDDDLDDVTAAKVRDIDGGLGPELPWALLGRNALRSAANEAGLVVLDSWISHSRAFAAIGTAARTIPPDRGNREGRVRPR